MRILYYSPHPQLLLNSNTGYGTHMREMIAAFKSMEHDVKTLIAGDLSEIPQRSSQNTNSGSAKKQSKIKGIIKAIIPKSVWSSLKDVNLIRFDNKMQATLEKTIEEWKPDVIYERCNYLQVSGVEVAGKRGIPHILEVNSPFVDENAYLEKGYNFFLSIARERERKQAKNTTLLVTVSTALKNYYSTFLKIPEKKILVVPNAIDPSHILIDEDRINAIKSSFKLEGKTVFGFVGSFFPWHGIDLMIKAFNEIDDPDTKLLIVGKGEIAEDLKLLASGLKRSKDIIFTGEVKHKEIYHYIAAMDICVLGKSHWYGSPVKLFEYGAVGKAIIAPDNMPVNDVMSDGVDGVLVKPTVRSLSDAMSQLLNNPDDAKRMAENFSGKVLHDYTWTNHAKKILNTLKDMIENK